MRIPGDSKATCVQKDIVKTNPIKFAVLVLGGSLATALAQTNSLQLPVAKGPFVGTMDSLTNYAYPKWFRETTDGLIVELPGEQLSDFTCSLRITGNGLSPAPLPTSAR